MVLSNCTSLRPAVQMDSSLSCKTESVEPVVVHPRGTDEGWTPQHLGIGNDSQTEIQNKTLNITMQ